MVKEEWRMHFQTPKALYLDSIFLWSQAIIFYWSTKYKSANADANPK